MRKISIIILLLLNVVIKAQSIKTPEAILTPNATSLGKYGDSQMNFYSGKVDVNIPIFELNENKIPLNIKMNYDTGGVRVGELPSWIGQNWNLSAGGVIVRTIKGKGPDEFIFEEPWPSSSSKAKGYMYNHAVLNTSNWNDPNYLKNVDLNADGYEDLEPDVFTFNFLNYTGKFFLGQDGNWKVQSDSNIKVEINLADKVLTLGRTTHCIPCYNDATPPKSIGKITLIDEVGTKYEFGNNLNSIEFSNDNFFDYALQPTKATAWYLNNVVDRFGNILYTFEYERGEYQPYFYLQKNYKRIDKETGPGLFTFEQGCAYSVFSNTSLIEGSLNMPVYLKRITSKSGYKITFNRSVSNYKYYTKTDGDENLDFRMNQWRSQFGNDNVLLNLSYVHDFYLLTHNANDQLIFTSYTDNGLQYLLDNTKFYKLDNIEIEFGYNKIRKIELQRNSNLNERLNLLGVSIKEGNNPQSQNYSFEYNDFHLLPYSLSKAIDHWGFYKGTNFDHYYYGLFNADNFLLHYATRNSNPTYLQIGSLKKIIYPTKGYSEFEYESNSYSKYVNNDLQLSLENNIAGGLRVKKITSNDGINNIVKEIKYTESLNSNVSSGILALKNQYYYPEWFTHTEANINYREKIFSINNLIPFSNFSGSHIGYSKVFEIQVGNGYSEYQFTDYLDYPDIPYSTTLSISHSIFDQKISNDFKRGKQKKVIVYNNSNQILKESTNNYQSLGSYKLRGFNYDFYCPCCPGVNDAVKVGNTYEVEYSDFNLASTEEKEYSNGSTLTNLTNFSYSNYPNDSTFFGDCFLAEQKSNNSLNEEVKDLYYYPFNSADHSQLLSSRYLVNVKTESYNNTSLISQKSTTFLPFTINGQSRFMPKFEESKKEQNTAYKTIEIDGYDNNGNVIEYHQADGIPTSLIWSNGNVLYKVIGATQSQINTQGIGAITSNSNMLVTRYTYNDYNKLIKIVYPNGDIENYIYDAANRLEKITDRNNTLIKKYIYNIKN